MSMKAVPKNMRIRETPIRVRKGNLNKIIVRKNSNSEGFEEINDFKGTKSMVMDEEI
jgi:hypothetical protein